MQKTVYNDSASPMYVLGQMIPPGETLVVSVPDEAPTEPTQPHGGPTLEQMVRELLDRPVSDLVAYLDTASADALDMMAALEAQVAKPRKTLLSAIAQEQMRRASAELDGDADGVKAAANAVLNAAMAALRVNQDPAKQADLRAAVLDAEDAARAAGVVVTYIDTSADAA